MNAGVATTAKKRRERERKKGGMENVSLLESKSGGVGPLLGRKWGLPSTISGQGRPLHFVLCDVSAIIENVRADSRDFVLPFLRANSTSRRAIPPPLSRPNRVIIVEGAQWPPWTDTIEGNSRLTRESRGSLPFYANILLAIMLESTLVCEQGMFSSLGRGDCVDREM